MRSPGNLDRRRRFALRGALLASGVGLGLGALWYFPVQQLTLDAMRWLQTAGPLGWVGFALLYLAVTVTLLPTSPLTMGGGFLFGPLTGFAVVWTSENLAALVSFFIGRYLARPTVARMVERSPVLSALDAAMHDRGFSLLVLIRHSPLVPFGVLNYSMSLTGITPGRYLAATLIGTAVPAFAYVYIGSTFTRLSDAWQGTGGEDELSQGLYWAGLAATLVATLAVSWYTRRALAERLEQAGVPR